MTPARPGLVLGAGLALTVLAALAPAGLARPSVPPWSWGAWALAFALPDTVRAVRARVGIVFADPDDQIVGLTVEEDVAFGPAPAAGPLLSGLGATLVVASHDLALVEQLRARAIILDDGRCVADAPIGEVLSDRALLARHGLE